MKRARNSPKWLRAARSSGGIKLDWISRALARAGVLGPGDIELALKSGRVSIDGKVAREPFAPIPEGARVQLDGREVDVRPRTEAVMFHKPKGLVTAGNDDEGLGTVFEALEAALPLELRGRTWLAVGRLDRNTTGLLLFTNDEQLVAFATSPATHLAKRYVATVSGAVTEEKLAPLRAGLALPQYTARPAQVRWLGGGRVELVLTEGKYHQVKHMLGAVGLPVLALHREAVGELALDVPEGKCRVLSAEEVRLRLGFEPRG